MKLCTHKAFILFFICLHDIIFASHTPNQIRNNRQQNAKLDTKKHTTSQPIPDWLQTLKILEPANKYTKKMIDSSSKKAKVQTCLHDLKTDQN